MAKLEKFGLIVLCLIIIAFTAFNAVMVVTVLLSTVSLESFVLLVFSIVGFVFGLHQCKNTFRLLK